MLVCLCILVHFEQNYHYLYIKKSIVCLLLMFQAAHGFMKTHKWRDTIGAFINVEASGSGGPGRI